MSVPLPIVVTNLDEARFECTFGRGCDGICCRNGRPPIYPEESQRIRENLDKFLPGLRPAARKLIEKAGFLSGRQKYGLPMLRVVDGWCVFFNQGCVLHKVGAAEGDKFRYKPALCALFPLAKSERGEWYVRQKGYEGECWDLFCLNPEQTTVPARESLQEELALAARFEAEATADSVA
ncbi:MAG: DUF3109 family protein [Gemmataceae bacterium]|nr:DUF3109 family protein [Gemmataceae bacterium]MDW8263928.1 DUF3109 family protein [Gemmataceae bacterium]